MNLNLDDFKMQLSIPTKWTWRRKIQVRSLKNHIWHLFADIPQDTCNVHYRRNYVLWHTLYRLYTGLQGLRSIQRSINNSSFFRFILYWKKKCSYLLHTALWAQRNILYRNIDSCCTLNFVWLYSLHSVGIYPWGLKINPPSIIMAANQCT